MYKFEIPKFKRIAKHLKERALAKKELNVNALVKAASEKLQALTVDSPVYKKIVSAAKKGVDEVMIKENIKLKQDLKDWRYIDKQRAINLFKEIQSGRGLVSSDFPEEMKGRIAKKSWDNSDFAYGMEYGALVVLRRFYNITLEDLK